MSSAGEGCKAKTGWRCRSTAKHGTQLVYNLQVGGKPKSCPSQAADFYNPARRSPLQMGSLSLGSCLSWEMSSCCLVIRTWLCPSVRAGARAQSLVRPSLHRTQRPSGKGLSHVCQMVRTGEDLVPYQGPWVPGFAWSRAQQGSAREWAVGCFICHRDETSPRLALDFLLQALGILF